MTEEEISPIWHMTFNLSLQMLHNEEDALDATQSIFEIVANRINQFRGDAKISTWIYRIAHNYLVDERKRKNREVITFELFEEDINHFQEYRNELSLSREEEGIYIEEVKIGCTKALLQCLDPEDRFVFILGTVFAFPQKESAEICCLSYDNYRTRLSRSRQKIRSFMTKNCGLLNPDAECKCRKRLLIAKERGRINYDKLLYRTDQKKIGDLIGEMDQLDEISRIYRDNPFLPLEKEDLARKIKESGILRETAISAN